jgi:hypothetical protein
MFLCCGQEEISLFGVPRSIPKQLGKGERKKKDDVFKNTQIDFFWEGLGEVLLQTPFLINFDKLETTFPIKIINTVHKRTNT